MPDPVSFTSTSPRHALPFLFAGQAQKEFFVNQGVAQIDLLLHPSVSGERADPPTTPAKGDCWILATAATGAWAGKDRAIAGWDGTQWLFVQPTIGMMVHDRTNGGRLSYDGQWRRISRPASPTGGTVVDVQARAAITAILDALGQFGVFSAS